jgi:hypothetical protein
MKTNPSRAAVRLSRVAILLVGLLLPLAMLPGCSQFVLLSYVLGGPPSIEPDFDAQTGKSLDRPDVTVAVIAYASTKLKVENPKIDVDLAKRVALRLASSKRINIVHPDTVHAWLDEHPDWEKAEEVGRGLKANYVIEIELESFSLYEEHSASLLRGRTEGYVNVHEISADGIGERIYSKDLSLVFPTEAPRSTYDQTLTSFKREYLTRLSELIGWMFIERYSGDKMHWAT